VDYSAYLVELARTRAAACDYSLESVQADARETGLPGDHFDHVLVMGNSLGYIVDTDADRDIIGEARRVLRSGGWLLVDVADGKAVRKTFSPRAWHEINDDMVVCRERELKGNTLWVREMVVNKEKGLIRDCSYAIRLYEDESLEALLEEVGFRQVKIHTGFSPHRQKGDYGFMNHRILGTGQKP
jgi:SAM-dependent methyltransferase